MLSILSRIGTRRVVGSCIVQQPLRENINYHLFNRSHNFFQSIYLQTAGHKTSSTATKRFIKTGSGNLKYKHAGKKHLNKHKGHARLKNLSQNGTLTGNWLKKMKLIL